MEYALDRFEEQVRAAILGANRVPDTLVEVASPKPNIPADLAFPTFRAANASGLPPPQLAQELAAAIQPSADSLIGGWAASGPFLNFTIDNSRLAATVLAEIERLGENYGRDDLGKGQTIVIDFSSPNVAKLMHIGHIRSTIIGQSLYNIFRYLGYQTIGDNHLGDWGKQFGMNIGAIMRWGKPEGDDEEAIAQLDKLYARYSALAKEDPAVDEEARSWSLRLEQGDPLAHELWQWMVDLTLRANRRNYDRLGIHFDHTYGESFYESMLNDVIQEAIEKGTAHRDEQGAVVVDLGDEVPTFLLQRSDGGTLYHTRDVATILFRLREFQANKIIYVVDARQELHFRQLFALVRRLGYAQEVELVHVKFGTVFDQHGKPLSTRAGNMIYLADLLDDAHTRARAVVERTSPDFPEEEKEQIAEMVGVGSVIYNDLFQDPRRNITLDWDRMLSLEGNSAPYIQYMHARCCSIVRKAAEQGRSKGATATAVELLTHPSEHALVKQLARLPGAVREAGARYTPFVIAEWCYETAKAFSIFYHACQVLKAETPDLREARLHLVAATAQALKNGLGLLGLKAPERM